MLAKLLPKLETLALTGISGDFCSENLTNRRSALFYLFRQPGLRATQSISASRIGRAVVPVASG